MSRSLIEGENENIRQGLVVLESSESVNCSFEILVYVFERNPFSNVKQSSENQKLRYIAAGTKAGSWLYFAKHARWSRRRVRELRPFIDA